ncbi:MAG: hypothetical protein KDC44_23705, partial [Phaeodactylibacter sp.]|nr:hypothetical protein [Phaeodactylibacter sp.]
MKTMNLPKFTWSLLCLLALHVGALAQSPPTRTAEGAFECEIVLDIYDGFYDWVEGKSYSGSASPLAAAKKYTPGAVCVANLNDTNGNGMGLGNTGVDLGETTVAAT